MTGQIRDLLSSSRSLHKSSIGSIVLPIIVKRRKQILLLPCSSDIFTVLKQRSLNSNSMQFCTGKLIKHSLRLLHVRTEVSTKNRLTTEYADLFAVPFLGSKIGEFANVTYAEIKKFHSIFKNGISVDHHNSLL